MWPIIITVWIAGAFLIAKFAKERGREDEVALWVCLNLLISPLLAFVILFCIEDKSGTQGQNRIFEKRNENNNNNNELDPEKFYRDLKNLRELFDNNIIDEPAYIAEKGSVINSLLLKRLLIVSHGDFLVSLIPLVKNNTISEDELTTIKSLLSSQKTYNNNSSAKADTTESWVCPMCDRINYLAVKTCYCGYKK